MPELVCAADAPRWHDERRKGVTATDITAITGLSPYESEYSLYWKKLGQIPDVREDSPRLRLGRDLEPLIRQRWREANGAVHLSGKNALWRNDSRSWQLATPDDLVWTDPNGGPLTGVLEVKSWADADRHAWDDSPPPRVRAQVLWQMDTLDVATGHVGVLFLPSGEFCSYTIEHPLAAEHDVAKGIEWAISGDSSLLCSVCYDIMLLRQAGEEFMRRLRLELPPPSPDASSATLAALKARFADPRKTKEAEVEAVLWAGFDEAKRYAAEYEQAAKGYEASIRKEIGEAGIITVGGVKVATRQRYTVKAHTRRESTVDKIVRSKGEADV